MFLTRLAVPRRTFLRGVGATIALPMLDAMMPALSAAPASTPRFSFIYIANGVIQDQWTPATAGADYELTPILRPLAAHKADINIISGLADRRARVRPHASRHRRQAGDIGGSDHRAAYRPQHARELD